MNRELRMQESRNTFMPRLGRLLAGLFAGLFAWSAVAFDIYQLPMSATAPVAPNVMLLVDNSGSMDNIIWADGFDQAKPYPDWGFDSNNGNYILRNIDNDTCANGSGRKVTGIRNYSRKTLCLPDPAGNGATRYTGNYLNYLFTTYPGGANLTDGDIPKQTRMQVARDVATDLVKTVSGVRFGVSTFYGRSSDKPYYSAHGATILESCEDASTSKHQSDLLDNISNLSADNNTPLAEALYEITRYFRGLASAYHDNTPYISPMQYRCQKNFAIVITDGFPTYDDNFPTKGDSDVTGGAGGWPDWDGKHPTTYSSTYPIFPPYSDGFGGDISAEGSTLYLDDIAKFGFDIDMKNTGQDLDGVSWNDPEFPKQNMTTYTVGFATANQMLQDAAGYSGGQYFTANNADQLKAALAQVLLDIQSKAKSASAVATNSGRADSELAIYQASFEIADWSGDLKAFDVDEETGGVGALLWQARDRLPAPTARKIFTTKSDTRAGTPFVWGSTTDNSLSDAQKNALKGTASTAASDTSNGINRLNYLRGDQTKEMRSGGTFRNRNYVLGDIVNSDPLFVGTPDYGYDTLPGNEGSSYAAFRAGSGYVGRLPAVYVGANDGMLHAFNASRTGQGAGSEIFAYVPLPAYANLRTLTDPGYGHRFFVDGAPQAGDAYIGGAWKTVLVGTLGAGGRGVFALDITDPASFGPSKVLWEKAVTGDTYVNITDDADLGYTYGQASIGRMANGKWAAIVSNGYNSGNKRAVLFILDLASGAVLKKIDTGVGSAANPVVDNGLSTPVIVDVNNDKMVDFIYAGDMQGNLWKFDVTASDPARWDVAFTSGSTKLPLFTATAPDNTVQPITAKPAVTRRVDGDLLVLFGTGKFFEGSDRSATSSAQGQSFYGVRDAGVRVVGGRSTLAEQLVTTVVNAFGSELRVTSTAKPTSTQNGWYLDLPAAGERQVSQPILRNGRVIFSTVIPSSDACHAGGVSWLMELDALSGSRLAFTPFDLNGDRLFSDADYVTMTVDGRDVKVPVSGRKSKVGVIKTPGVVQAGGLEYKYTGGSGGEIEVIRENPGPGAIGRQSWRQLQ